VKRPRTWWTFGACAGVVVAALGWITYVSLDLEAREREARGQARFQETLRLALWRMDSALSPVIAREAARPYFHYAPFYAEELAFNAALASVEQGKRLIPSPLLAERSEHFRIHFQIAPDGSFSSPQAPVGIQCDVAVGNDVCTPAQIDSAKGLLQAAAALVRRERVLAEIERASPEGFADRQGDENWSQETVQEFNVRQQAASRVRSSAQASKLLKGGPSPAESVEQGALVPIWLHNGDAPSPELFLCRVVQIGKRKTVQGIWMDWEKAQDLALGEVRDLLPQAALLPAFGLESPPIDRLLATIPAVLVPGAAPQGAAAFFTPARAVLALAWAACLGAALAAGAALRAALDLGERRGQFVSAVTHELRTPLTTFRLYSQMLADGMVKDEKARGEYLATLKDESERLSRVVENVLLYARVESGRKARGEVREAEDLLAGISPRLEQLARDAGMSLSVDGEDLRGAVLEVDPQALEQILQNLVDNSAKYARGSDDPTIRLTARASGSCVEILVRDHGPGIPEGDRSRVFAPFHRGNREVEIAAAGLGLGLSLSRGLARQWGGELELVSTGGDGAAFRLTLPLAKRG